MALSQAQAARHSSSHHRPSLGWGWRRRPRPGGLHTGARGQGEQTGNAEGEDPDPPHPDTTQAPIPFPGHLLFLRRQKPPHNAPAVPSLSKAVLFGNPEGGASGLKNHCK